MKMNMDGVDPWKAGELLPVGWHPCEVMEIEEEFANSGSPQIKVSWESFGGDAKGGSITDWITVTEKTMGRVLMFLNAIGYEVPDGEFEFQPGRAFGKRARVLVIDDIYNGETKRKVKGYSALRETDVPADLAGLGANGSSKADDDIPF